MSKMCTQHQREISPRSCSAVQPLWTDREGLVSRMSLPVLKEQEKTDERMLQSQLRLEHKKSNEHRETCIHTATYSETDIDKRRTA